jgi:hypothetical protein
MYLTERGGKNMLIQVLRTDNHYDYVKDFVLDSLIESNGIVQFRRKTGWATIGIDPIRKNKQDNLPNNTDRMRATDSGYFPEYHSDNQ